MRTSWLVYLRLSVIALVMFVGCGVCLAGDDLDVTSRVQRSITIGYGERAIQGQALNSKQYERRQSFQPTLDLVPVAVSAGTAVFSGNSVTVDSGDVTVELELRVSGWGTVGDGQLVNVSAKVDGVGYCSGAGDPVVPVGYPVNPLFDCAMGAGLGCPGDGNTCDAGAFVPDKICSGNSRYCRDTLPCDINTEGFCISNPEFVFSGMEIFKAVQFPGLDYIFSTLTLEAGGQSDTGQMALFGVLFVKVPTGAAGTYTIDFHTGVDGVPGSSITGIFDGAPVFYPFETINPARIIVGSPSGGNGDFTGDRRIDLRDVQRFQRCFSSPDVMLESGCHAGDTDNDDDIDLSDYADFYVLIQ